MAANDNDDRKKRRGSGGAVRRALGFLAFLPVASHAPLYTRLMWPLVRDERTPAGRKALLAGALGYVILGRDLFLDGVPADVLTEKLIALGIDRAAFEQDVAQIRRLTPGPIRRLVRRLPHACGIADRAVKATGLGPRIRSFVSEEDSIA